ncbi:MAG: hypothetical protein KDK55_01565 [Chlamydiia bacterium]|nr:hypothetical protein [Chlamydiia bacterium]
MLKKKTFDQGLIIGPYESKQSFWKRVNSSHPSRGFSAPLFTDLFGFHPNWVEIFYSRKGLTFFQGGCAWIEGNNVSLQLHPSFEKKGSLFGIYHKDEILAHELVHAVRLQFDEPLFEEVLAYQTSKSPFRRYFGPLLQSDWESFCFLSLIVSFAFLSFFSIPLAQGFALGGVMGYSIFLILRLAWKQKHFHQCIKNLTTLLDSRIKARRLALGLTDREILLFSRSSPQTSASIIEQKKIHSYRWQLLSVLLE